MVQFQKCLWTLPDTNYTYAKFMYGLIRIIQKVTLPQDNYSVCFSYLSSTCFVAHTLKYSPSSNHPNHSDTYHYLFTLWQRVKSTCLCNFYLVMSKGKVVPVLFFNWAPCYEGILGEWRYSTTHSLTLALDGNEWSASRPGRFIPRERASGTHWIGGWVDPRAVLDTVVKRKIPSSHQ
jgi:hypothetical protein